MINFIMLIFNKLFYFLFKGLSTVILDDTVGLLITNCNNITYILYFENALI